MWYKIERNLNSFIISNTGSKDLYLTLFLSEKCDIDVNYKVCIEEVIIEEGDSYTFNLPIKDGLYKLFLTDKEENYQKIFIPQYLELLSSLIEDIDYVLCGCDFKDCDGNDYDNDTEVLSTLLKILSYISINKNKYEKAITSSNACVECDILESNLCILINENVGENYQNKNLIKKLIAFYYLVFYYTDYKIENSLETIQQRYNFKKIYPCIKKLGLSIKCIEDNWDKNEQSDFTPLAISHKDTTDKNAEPNFQHVTQEEKTYFHTHTNKEYLDNYNPTLFATALQGEKADSALQSLPPNIVIDADYPTLKDKVNGIEENAKNYIHPFQHSTQILSGVSSIAGNPEKYLNERGDFKTPIISHSGVTNKNTEADFQHIDTTTTKETLVEDDKLTIFDSVTGKVVLTNKNNVGLQQVVTDGVTIKGNGTPDSKIELNFTGLNEADNYFVTQFEKEQIAALSPIEFSLMDVVNGVILLENPYKMYRISVTEDMTITMNTSLVDLNKYIKFFLKVNINSNVVLTFPQNFYFANLAIPTEIGEYLYEVSTSDSGATWRASLRYKNIATVGIDVEGNEIIGAKLLFVDGEKADNSGNGLTWLTAKKDVQAAIDIANTGDAVFVKGKIDGLKYLPTTERTPGDARSKSFVMKPGVNVYGGFKGIESTLYEREMVSYLQVMKLPSGTFTRYVDIPKYRCILSGEIDRDGVLKPTGTLGNQFTTESIANNSYTVVMGVTGVTVNGFEIIGGNANVAGNNTGGGAIQCTLTNCAIYNNSASNTGGGAIQCTLTNCAIYNNSATNSAGGTSGGTLTNCAIYNNSATNSGGGGTGGGTLTNCAIYNNSSAYGGGAGGGTLTNCAIYNNRSVYGGSGVSSVTSTNCAIYNNSGGDGGGVSGGTLTNCAIYNNSATSSGGVSGGTLTNCAIYNNSATNSGGGASNATLTNCSVVRNKATNGAGTYNTILRNTVVYGNKHTTGVKQNVVNTNSSVETYSAFEDEIRAGEGNISLSLNNEGDATSPCFQSLSTDAGVVDEIYVSNPRICNDSFLVDKGLNSLNASGWGSEYDLAGLPRKVDIIDIGAYENQKII